jgi:hypothetical protein
MSKFGWSYPPGCSGPPDDDYPCEVCGRYDDDCLCPVCEVCDHVGNPACYELHGLVRTQEQIASLANKEAEWAADAEAEAKWWNEHSNDKDLWEE